MNAIKQYFSKFTENCKSNYGLYKNFKYLWVAVLVSEIIDLFTGTGIVSFIIGLLTAGICYIWFGASGKEIVFRVTNNSKDEYVMKVDDYPDQKLSMTIVQALFKPRTTDNILNIIFHVLLLFLFVFDIVMTILNFGMVILGYPLWSSLISSSVVVVLMFAVLMSLALTSEGKNVEVVFSKRPSTYKKE